MVATGAGAADGRDQRAETRSAAGGTCVAPRGAATPPGAYRDGLTCTNCRDRQPAFGVSAATGATGFRRAADTAAAAATADADNVNQLRDRSRRVKIGRAWCRERVCQYV